MERPLETIIKVEENPDYNIGQPVDENCWKCGICGAGFSSKKSMEAHTTMTHSFYRCPHCSETFKYPTHLTDHLKICSPNTNPKNECNVCGEEFSTKRSMQSHMVWVHNVAIYKCVYCENVAFKKKSEFIKHMTKSHNWKSPDIHNYNTSNLIPVKSNGKSRQAAGMKRKLENGNSYIMDDPHVTPKYQKMEIPTSDSNSEKTLPEVLPEVNMELVEIPVIAVKEESTDIKCEPASDYDIETIDISSSTSVLQASETQVIDLNIKSESNPNSELVKSEPLESNPSFDFFPKDQSPFLLFSAPGDKDSDFFLGPQTSTATNDLNDMLNSTPTLIDEKTTGDSSYIKEELVLVPDEIENNIGNQSGSQTGSSTVLSDKFKCYHCGENFANISSLNAHAAHVHNICIHKCPHCPGDGPKFKFRTHLVEHIMLHHPGKSIRTEFEHSTRVTTDSGIEYDSKNRRLYDKKNPRLYDTSRASWFVKTKCDICGEEFSDISHAKNHARWAHPGHTIVDRAPKPVKPKPVPKVPDPKDEPIDDRPIKCVTCGERFDDVKSMQAHAARMHNAYIHQCQFCVGVNISFKYKKDLYKHYTEEHGKQRLQFNKMYHYHNPTYHKTEQNQERS